MLKQILARWKATGAVDAHLMALLLAELAIWDQLADFAARRRNVESKTYMQAMNGLTDSFLEVIKDTDDVDVFLPAAQEWLEGAEEIREDFGD